MTDNVPASQPLHSVWQQFSSADADQTTVSWSRSAWSHPLLHGAINLWHPSDTEQESLSPSVPPCSLLPPCVLWTFYGVNQAKQTRRLQTGLGKSLLLILFLICLASKSVKPFFVFSFQTTPTFFYLLLHLLFHSLLLLPGFENHYSQMLLFWVPAQRLRSFVLSVCKVPTVCSFHK